MQKLKTIINCHIINCYITNGRPWDSLDSLDFIRTEDKSKSFEFAYSMTFEGSGAHRDHRSGGQHRRQNGEVFIHAFQGKLTEFAISRFLNANGVPCPMPDTQVWKLGKWDSFDLMINGYKVNVKSTKFFGNLLLLETGDWNENAQYIPNLSSTSGGAVEYDFHVLTRMKPNGEDLMKSKKWFYSNNVQKDELRNLILNVKWEFDIPGYVTNDQLKQAITSRQILPQKAMLNGRALIDADNYYIQAGDMSNIAELLNLLKESSDRFSKNACGFKHKLIKGELFDGI